MERQTILVLCFLSLAVSVLGDDIIKCYQCVYGEKGAEKTGNEQCVDPPGDTVGSEPCSGSCYKVQVEAEEGDQNIHYVQRGCLVGCRDNGDYTVQHYGIGSLECCDGDLCNHSNAVLSNSLLIILVTLFSTIMLARING